MKMIKVVLILAVAYAGVVITFESLLGYFQPADQSTLVITTTDSSGAEKDRVLARLESDGHMYVAANHWPRAWYNQTLAHPNVIVFFDGSSGEYVAVPVTGDEHERVNSDNKLGVGFRVLTGFPPRYFLRLDSR